MRRKKAEEERNVGNNERRDRTVKKMCSENEKRRMSEKIDMRG